MHGIERRHGPRWVGLAAGVLIPWLAAPLPAAAHEPLPRVLTALERRAEEAPEDPRAHLERAEFRRLAGDLAGALDDLDVAFALDPDLWESHLYRGRLLLEAGRPGDALAALDRFLAAPPTPTSAKLRPLALSLRARALVRLGRTREAIAALDAALAAAPHPGPELYLERARLVAGTVLEGGADEPVAAADRGRLEEALAGLDEGLARLGPVVPLAPLARKLELRLGRPEREIPKRPAPAAVGRVPAAAATAQVVRGPYLQLATPSSAVVRWRTDVPTASRVDWGPAPDQLTQTVTEPTPTTEHEVFLDGLEPATLAFYAVGTPESLLTGGDGDHFFRTSPTPGTPAPARIWVLGDSGTGNADAAAVRDAFLAATGVERPDVWLMLGDNAYPAGTDADYQAAVFDLYPTLLRNTFLWSVVGNHDALSADSPSQTGPYFDLFTLPTAAEAGGLASGTEAYYSFDWGDIHFVCLDSADSDRSADGAMLQWLAADLEATHRSWVLALFHHPPYSKGSHDSDNPADSGGRLFDMRQNVLPLLEAHGVDLVLGGHSHAYERSFLLDGHYGTSDMLSPATMVLDGGNGRPGGDGAYEKAAGTHNGAVYVVAGSSGRTGGGSLDHPAMFVGLAELGSLVLDIRGNRLDATFLDAAGTARDTFTLIRAPSPLFQDGFESGNVSAWSASR